MSLELLSTLMAHASAQGYALGYFESWDMASLQGVIDAAERVNSPVILGFNGEFLTREDRLAAERLAIYAEMGKAAARTARIPCTLIFNECPRDDQTCAAVEAGFSIVGVAAGESEAPAYQDRVAKVTRFAHARGVAVEAEVGSLPSGAPMEHQEQGSLTDPQAVASFVRATGIDLLGVSVGNVHIKLEGQVSLDLDRLAAIREQCSIPLVLHGGTGIARDSLLAAVRLGVRKVNYGSYLKQNCLKALRQAIQSDATNPHELLGMGGERDLLMVSRLAVRDAVLERIELLGSCGRA